MLCVKKLLYEITSCGYTNGTKHVARMVVKVGDSAVFEMGGNVQCRGNVPRLFQSDHGKGERPGIMQLKLLGESAVTIIYA